MCASGIADRAADTSREVSKTSLRTGATAGSQANPSTSPLGLMTFLVRLMIVLSVFACIGCEGRAGRATEYRPGTPLSTIVAELGPPDEDKPIPPEFAATGLCPADTVRVVSYLGPYSMS